MNIPIFDRIEGLTEDERTALRNIRFSPDGQVLLRVLTEFRPTTVPVLGEGFDRSTAEYLLGCRDAWDGFVRGFKLIGSAPPPPRTALPSPRYKPKPKVKADVQVP